MSKGRHTNLREWQGGEGERLASKYSLECTLDKTSKSILFVDDESEFAVMMSKVLDLRGFFVQTANSGAHALKAYSSQEYDLVVTDLSMPGMDGIELVREIRKMNPSQRIIIITGFPSQMSQRQAFKLGTINYIVKPFSINRFLEVVAEALEEEDEDGLVGPIRLKCEDLIQMYALGAKNIVIEIMNAQNGDMGRVYIEKGKVVHAEVNKLKGEHAFYEIQSWNSGIFRTEALRGRIPHTIDRSPDALILEAARRCDEKPDSRVRLAKK